MASDSCEHALTATDASVPSRTSTGVRKRQFTDAWRLASAVRRDERARCQAGQSSASTSSNSAPGEWYQKPAMRCRSGLRGCRSDDFRSMERVSATRMSSCMRKTRTRPSVPCLLRASVTCVAGSCRMYLHSWFHCCRANPPSPVVLTHQVVHYFGIVLNVHSAERHLCSRVLNGDGPQMGILYPASFITVPSSRVQTFGQLASKR